MLLGATTETGVSQDRSCERRALLSNIIESIQSAFPSITIRLLNHVPAVNAQASCSGDERLVDIFGGLAFHPAVGADALYFSLLHEIGHHLGSGARMTPGCPLACDCAADRWAILQGLPEIAKNNTEVNAGLAMTQLEKALPCPEPIETFRMRNENCWCWDWSRRKQHLSAGDVPAVQTCFMFDGGNFKPLN
jgi:hypothetical protein